MTRVGRAWRNVGARTFRSLSERNYRLFFIGHATSVIGTWMQRVAQDWLVLTLTDSAIALGITAAMQFTPMLVLGLWGGAVVDRVDKRRLIIGTQVVQGLLAVALAVLTITGAVELWMVYALALALGLVTVLDNPARQAFVAEMVEPENYVNAQALNSTVHNMGRLLGPAAAGLLIATVGVGAAFAINAVSFLAVIAGLIRMDSTALRRPPRKERRRGQAREGLRYVWGIPELRAVLFLVLVVALFGQNFRVVLPLFASDTFASGAEVYGYLTAALGLGSVVGAVGSASRETATSWGLVLFCIAFGAVNLAAAAAPNLVVAYLVMIALGVTNIVFNTLARAILLLRAEPSMQGRVIALHQIIFLGSIPLGGPLLGWVTELWGARFGFVLAGATALAAGLWLLPRLRRVNRGVMAGPGPPATTSA